MSGQTARRESTRLGLERLAYRTRIKCRSRILTFLARGGYCWRPLASRQLAEQSSLSRIDYVGNCDIGNRDLGNRMSRPSRILAVGALLTCVGPTLLPAAEPALEFVAALGERGWHDTALDYLDRLDSREDLPATQRARLPLERARILALQARGIRNQATRRTASIEAADRLAAFGKTAAASPESIEAFREAANLYAEAAFSTLAAAERLPQAAASEREALAAEARAAFASAQAAAENVLSRAAEQLASLPKPAEAQANPETRGRRGELENKQQEARFLIAKLLYETAKTYPAESPRRKKQLEEAASAFQALFLEFENKLVGYYGRLYEGRAYQAAGNYEEALVCYRDLLEVNTTNPAFRQLMAEAMQSHLQTLRASGELEEAADDGRRWLSASESAERSRPEWQAVAYELAEVLRLLSEQSAGAGSAQSKLESEARLLLRDVAQSPGEFQQEARLKLARLGRSEEEAEEYRRFDEAFAAGKRALELSSSAQMAARLAAENNPSAVEELQQQAKTNSRLAVGRLEQALALADRETPLGELNEVRYYLSVLYWQAERLEEAAILGEFVARRYPANPHAERAAQVALAAVERLYLNAQQDPAAQSDFLRGELASIAEWMATRWPESSQAGAAVNLLINVALAEDRIDQAEALLERLPAGTRPAAEVSLGGALWRQSIRQAAEGTPEAEARASTLRRRAREMFEAGYAGLSGRTDPSAATAAGLLYFAQLLLAQGDAAQALEILEAEGLGPLDLVENSHPAAERADYQRSVYRTALRAVLSLESPDLERTRELMQSLEASAESQAELTGVYLGLAGQLQQQIQQLLAQAEEEKARNVATALDDLLARIADQTNEKDWSLLNQLAAANLELGELLAGEARQRAIERAKALYTDILKTARDDPSFAPGRGALLAVRKRLADSSRGLGKYDEALTQYAAILKQKSSMLQLQQAAAETLLLQGIDNKNVEALRRSIFGTLPQDDGKNLIWGWIRLAKVADYAKQKASDEKTVKQYQDLFFEARYNVAKARFSMAGIGPPARRSENLQIARRSVTSMKSLYPDLGGPRWAAAYNELLQQIEQASQ